MTKSRVPDSLALWHGRVLVMPSLARWLPAAEINTQGSPSWCAEALTQMGKSEAWRERKVPAFLGLQK